MGENVDPAALDALASLAQARKDLAIHPTVASVRVGEFRRTHGLAALPGARGV